MARTRSRKILIGCLVALGAVVLLAIAGCTLFVRWLQTPGEPLATNRLIDEQTRIYVELRLDETNPGARGLVRVLLEAHQDLQARPGTLPPVLAWLQNTPQRDIPDEEIDDLLPLSAILTGQSREALPDGGTSFTVNLPSAANSFRLLDRFLAFSARRSTDMEYLLYRDEAYYRLAQDDGDTWMSIVDANLVFALREPPMRSAIDRLTRPPDTLVSRSPPLAPLLSGFPPDSVLRVAVLEQTAGLLELIEPALPELAVLLEQIIGESRALTGWLRVERADVLVGEFQAEMGETGVLSSRPILLGDTIRLALDEQRIHLTLEPIPAGRIGWEAWRLRAEGLISGLTHALHQAIEDS